MKKIFCDCCGKEFEYDARIAITNGKPHTVKTKLETTGKLQDFEVTIMIVPKRSEIPGEKGKRNEHADICESCRWQLVNKVNPTYNPASNPANFVKTDFDEPVSFIGASLAASAPWGKQS